VLSSELVGLVAGIWSRFRFVKRSSSLRSSLSCRRLFWEHGCQCGLTAGSPKLVRPFAEMQTGLTLNPVVQGYNNGVNPTNGSSNDSVWDVNGLGVFREH
jgi:hypothetical protein